MDKGALQELQGITAAALGPRRVGDGAAFAIVSDDWHVESLEHFAPVPSRARGAIHLQDAASFVAWVNERKGYNTRIYATAPLPDGPHYAAIIDDTIAADAPQWRQWRALYSPLPSPEWAIWSGANGKRVAQADFAEFIEQNAADLFSGAANEPTAAQMLELSANLTATTKAEFASGVRLSNGARTLRYSESTQASAGTLEVPEIFWLAIPVYIGGPSYKIGARLRYRIENNSLRIGYDLIRPHKIIETAAQEITDEIKEKCAVPLYTGQPGQ